MLQITQRIEWDMGHRLGDGYKSKCKHLHGHRYKAEVTFAAPNLDQYGMVLDFGEIKRVCKGWIDVNIDHAFLVCNRDQSLHMFLKGESQRFFLVDFNTTIENITPWLLTKLQYAINLQPELLEREVKITRLKVWETPNCSAEVTIDG